MNHAGISNIVVNPASLAVAANDKVKTDRRDSKRLAVDLADGRLRGIYVPTEEEELAHLLPCTRAQLVEHRVVGEGAPGRVGKSTALPTVTAQRAASTRTAHYAALRWQLIIRRVGRPSAKPLPIASHLWSPAGWNATRHRKGSHAAPRCATRRAE